MSSTGTISTTFTVADIKKVVDNFAADFSMMGQSTGLKSREEIARTVSDLKVFAEHHLLVKTTLILKNELGNQIRGAKYEVSESATGWVTERPGNGLWPRTPGGKLIVVATLTQAWWDKTEAGRAAFVAANKLNSSWGITSEDTTLQNLTAAAGQQYVSNGYGWQRTNYC